MNRIIRVGEPLPEKRKRKKLTVIAARLKNAAEDEEDLLLPPSPIFVAEVRRRMELSQKVFARRLRIPLSTLRKWESNDTQPTGAAATLIEILDHRPELIHLLAE
ncbi:MAG: helix-turn-helix domain-containing protein [Verrucomicrobiales bacterium]|nr:helix-turn-helix domain-containing protein [Verrucomicrobiales bacterium]